MTWYYISVFLHVIGAAFWIGGMLFLPLVVLPVLKNNPDRVPILYKTGLKLRFYGWIALGLLFVTGFTNMYLRGLPISLQFFFEAPYGKLASVKLLLFAGIIVVSGIHDFFVGRQAIEDMMKGSERMRKIASWSGRIMLLLALSAAFVGILLSRGAVF